MAEYPNRGVLFTKDKRSDKAPDFGGDFTIDDELLDYLVEQASKSNTVKLSISGWKRNGAKGSFISLQISKPWSPDDERKEAPVREARTPDKPVYVRGKEPAKVRHPLDDDIPFAPW